MRQTDDHARAHRRVRIECRFDLGRVHVPPAAENHVGAAVRDVEVAVRVEPPEITHRLPAVRRPPPLGTAVREGRAGTRGRQHVDLPDFARRQFATLLVQDLHATAVHRATNRARALQPFGSRDERAADALTRAVAFEHALGSQPLDPGPEQPLRARRTAGKHELERGKIVASAHFLRQLPDPVQHRRYEEHPIDAMPLDELQALLGIEAAHHHDLPAREQPTPGGAVGSRVIERTWHQHRVA